MGNSRAVYAILQNVYGTSPWSLEQIEADMRREDTTYFFVSDKAIVGFLAVQWLGQEAEMTQIAVLKSYQGRGYGDLLLNQLTGRTQDIFLEVRASNQAAIGLYTKHGFQMIGRRKNYYHAPIEDALLMKREGYDKSIPISH